LDVCGTSLNSSNSKMAGVRRLNSPPSRTSHFEPLPLFLRRRRIIRRCLTKGVGSSDPTVFSTVAVKFQTNCRRHLSDQLVRRHLHKPSDHPVLNADLNSEPTALILLLLISPTVQVESVGSSDPEARNPTRENILS